MVQAKPKIDKKLKRLWSFQHISHSLDLPRTYPENGFLSELREHQCVAFLLGLGLHFGALREMIGMRVALYTR